MEMVTVYIDDTEVKVPSDYTVLKAAQKAGVKIPTLCYLKDINQIGACRVCLVEIERARGLQASCVYPVSEGLRVHTHTPKVLQARKAVVELLLSNHPQDCLTCSRSCRPWLRNWESRMCLLKASERPMTWICLRPPSCGTPINACFAAAA